MEKYLGTVPGPKRFAMTSLGSDYEYSVPVEAKKLLEEGILQNPSHSDFPQKAAGLGDYVEYVGSARLSIAINWRSAESVLSLKGLEAVMINVLLERKYRLPPQKVVINT